MSSRWDLAVHDRNHQLVLVAEVKSKLNTTPDWAARFRRNIFAHGILPNAPYFLMAFPDSFYLWVQAVPNGEPSKPDYTIDAHPILQPYLEKTNLTAAQIGEHSLELILASWLSDIMSRTANEIDASQQWLIDSGLHEAIVEGHLVNEVLV